MAVMEARVRTLFQYRAAALAALGTRMFWGLIRTMVFAGFFAASTARQPISPEQMTSYVWLGQAMLGMTLTWVDGDIRTMIRTGSVAYELARPVDLYWFWFARSFAARLAPTLIQGTPILLVAGLFLGLRPPPTLEAGLGWCLGTFLALLLSSAIGTIATISLLWTVSGEGVSRLLPSLSYVLSGMVVPLPFWPSWVQGAMAALPFVGLIDSPFRIYLGQFSGAALAGVLLHQVIWTVLLIAAGRCLLARGTRRLVVQGG